MKFATVRIAAKELKVSESRLRRDATAGRIDHLMIGNRLTIDVDQARAYYPASNGEGIDIKEISELTGLKQNSIRLGAQEGWIPFWWDGKRRLFNPEDVLDALAERMRAQKNKV